MRHEQASPVDLSAEAALELEELGQAKREDSPALIALFAFLRTPASTPVFNGNSSLSMLADVRAYTVLRDSIGKVGAKSRNFSDFSKTVEKYLNELELGVKNKTPKTIEEAKRFCLSLTENLLSKRMAELYERRERLDSRYVSHDSLS